MFINIITPCSRPQNLHNISKSINVPNDRYRWIVVCDSDILPDIKYIPDNCEIYCFKDINSISGNAQRNFAIDLVTNGYLYFNDDDTILHPQLWDSILELNNDFIHFAQIWKDGKLRLTGEKIELAKVDSHNFLVSIDLVENVRWILNKYEADGYFAIDCHQKSKNSIYLPQILSIYNFLR